MPSFRGFSSARSSVGRCGGLASAEDRFHKSTRCSRLPVLLATRELAHYSGHCAIARVSRRMLTLRRKGNSPEDAVLTKSHPNISVADPSALGPVTPEEARLLAKLDLARLPRHVAVIMDGNGRWAQRKHLPRAAGHRSGTQTARTTIETCARLKVEALTLYAFSVENWRRPKTETDFLMALLREYLRQEMPLIQRNDIRMRFLGRSEELPAGVQQDMRNAEEKTAGNGGMVLCLALNYGGRAEIVDAANAVLAERGAHGSRAPVTEEEISRRLYTVGLPDPDL